MSRGTKSEMNTDSAGILEALNNPNVKLQLLEGLNKLGFPLEFKIRKKLIDRGYNNVQEGHFIVYKNSDEIKILLKIDFQ